ncbi:MAG: SIS domain-containing protein [Deltaproteobacteria bacterium]|nr:SIS domain-containing protein [Deltaproteobacteria bacterium]
MSYLDREIADQPAVLERLFSRESRQIDRAVQEIRAFRPQAVFLVARGSSDNAGLYGKYLFGARNRLVVALATPSLFTLYRRPPDLSGCLVLAISQSGRSDDLVGVVAEGRRQGAYCLVLTNEPRSPLAREASRVIDMRAGRERSVAATKTYTAELMALAMLSVGLDGRARDREALARMPEAVAGTLEAGARIEELAGRYRYAERLAVIGRGYNYATAFEVSLKLKELAYLTAEPSSSADFRHGPIAVVQEGFPVLLIAPRGRTLDDMRDLARALDQRRAEILAISDVSALLRTARTALAIPPGTPEWLSPLLAVLPGQLLARHLAAARGCPLDRPRGLAKVTRTR